MRTDYQKLFQNLDTPTPPPYLLGKIMQGISAKQKANTRRHFYIAAALMLVSLVAFIPVIQTLVTDLTQSGFLYFTSLLFSDFSAISGIWQTYAFSLLETLPVTGMILCMGVLYIFLQSLQSFTRDLQVLYFQKTI